MADVSLIQKGGTKHHLHINRPLRIGRADSNDVVWNESWISSHHCEVTLNEFGLCSLKVMSSNGAWIIRDGNITAVKAKSSKDLIENDYILIKGPKHGRKDLQLQLSYGGTPETKSNVVWKLLHILDRIRGLERDNTQLESKLQCQSRVLMSKKDDDESITELDQELEKSRARKEELEKQIAERLIYWEKEVEKEKSYARLTGGDELEKCKQVRTALDHVSYKHRLAMETVDPTLALMDLTHPGRERGKGLDYADILAEEERLRREDEKLLKLEDAPKDVELEDAPMDNNGGIPNNKENIGRNANMNASDAPADEDTISDSDIAGLRKPKRRKLIGDEELLHLLSSKTREDEALSSAEQMTGA